MESEGDPGDGKEWDGCGTVTHRTRCAAAAEKEPLRATIKSGRKRRCQNRGTGETVFEGRGSR